MRNSKLLQTILVNAGLTLFLIGLWITLAPEGFFNANGVFIGDNINLMNELKALGGLLTAMGMLIFAGAFVRALTYTALVTGSVLYLSYALSRGLSLLLDGIPSPGLLAAAAVELAFGVACVYAWYRYRIAQSRISTG